MLRKKSTVGVYRGASDDISSSSNLSPFTGGGGYGGPRGGPGLGGNGGAYHGGINYSDDESSTEGGNAVINMGTTEQMMQPLLSTEQKVGRKELTNHYFCRSKLARTAQALRLQATGVEPWKRSSSAAGIRSQGLWTGPRLARYAFKWDLSRSIE